jgi:outer membrane protein OmpA-like peptidoglycan-associated protein
MKKAMVLKLVVFLLAGLILFPLTACSHASSSSETPVAVAIVLGNRQCGRKPNLNNSTLDGLVQQMVASAGFLSWVEVEGEPQCQNEYKISAPSTFGLSQKQINRVYTQQADGLLANLTSVKAKTPEADVLQALNIASRSLADAPQGSSKQIIVLDSGLSTKGVFNFTISDFLDTDPSVAVNYLVEQKNIPDLSGVTVTFIGLGDTSAPQQQLSGSQVDNLQQIWRGIVEKGNGKANILDALPGSDIPTTGYPTVSTVSVLSDASSTFDNSSAVVFRNIQFIGDSATYSDSEAAISALQPVANYMKAHPEFAILLIGTTAGDNDKDYCFKLSFARASAVRSTLISLGVSAGRTTVMGMGFEDPWHILDTSNGGLIESVAAQNRKVVLLNASSNEARKILAGND